MMTDDPDDPILPHPTLTSELVRMIAAGKEIQIKFKYDASPGPVGPGKVEQVSRLGIFRIMTPALVGDPRSGQQRRITMPLTFSIDDVLWFNDGMIEAEQPAIVAPSGRTPGGLHIG